MMSAGKVQNVTAAINAQKYVGIMSNVFTFLR
jgi:hypothetical protein